MAFWIGVPVMTQRERAGVSAAALDCFVDALRIKWPSSRTILCHFTCVQADSEMWGVEYVLLLQTCWT